MRFRAADRGEGELEAPLVLLATGSRCAPLEAFGVCRRTAPSAVAVRGYYRDLSDRHAERMYICFDRLLGRGYGWVYPQPGGIYSIGCLRFFIPGREEQPPLQPLLEAFIHRFAPAREIVAQDDPIGLPCGGVLRTGLGGAESHADGLLLAGEALGTTAPFTGEGVGMALGSGLLAAEVAAAALAAGDVSALFLGRYRQLMEERFRSTHRGLQRAQGWLDRPRRLNLLAWQAARKPLLRQALAGMLAGRVAPAEIFSLAGLLGRARQRQGDLTPPSAGSLAAQPETSGGEG